MINKYYRLTKPGIIRGNLLTVIGGFLLASKGVVDGWLLLQTVVGSTLVMASGCVFNNYLDQEIDAKMKRTQKRALVSGEISKRSALVFGVVLGVLGIATLIVFTNPVTVLVGMVGWFAYVVVYSIFKRRTRFGTLVGSVSGAIPPVAGYTAVTSTLDLGAVLLFVILVCWQMPHFYAISIFRRKDYSSANIPVLPLVKGVRITKRHILYYIAAFIGVASLLTLFDYTGYAYLFVVCGLGFIWFYVGAKRFRITDDTKWARNMFGMSLIVLLGFSVMISLDSLLP